MKNLKILEDDIVAKAANEEKIKKEQERKAIKKIEKERIKLEKIKQKEKEQKKREIERKEIINSVVIKFKNHFSLEKYNNDFLESYNEIVKKLKEKRVNKKKINKKINTKKNKNLNVKINGELQKQNENLNIKINEELTKAIDEFIIKLILGEEIDPSINEENEKNKDEIIQDGKKYKYVTIPKFNTYVNNVYEHLSQKFLYSKIIECGSYEFGKKTKYINRVLPNSFSDENIKSSLEKHNINMIEEIKKINVYMCS
jgi:hypothetical protein